MKAKQKQCETWHSNSQSGYAGFREKIEFIEKKNKKVISIIHSVPLASGTELNSACWIFIIYVCEYYTL